MRKVNKHLRIIVFSLSLTIFLLFSFLPFNGDWYYYCNVVLCSICIISGIILIIYSLKSSVKIIKYEYMYYLISILIVTLLSFNFYSDLFIGKKETINDQYYIASKDYSINNPNSTKTIKIPYNNNYIELYVTEQQWEYLINNNALNHSDWVVDPITGDSHYPHYYPIKITFYEKSKIISTIEIIE